MPVSAAHMPEMTKPSVLMRSTLMPESRAAAALPPTAWISWPIDGALDQQPEAAEDERP